LRPLQKQVSRSVSANIVSAIHQQQIFWCRVHVHESQCQLGNFMVEYFKL
jgi:hypothetical protein